jgi:hypothetical protein
VRRPRGAVNLVNLTLTVAVLSGGYLAWLYVPLWLDDLDVREALAAGAGQLTSENLGMTESMIQKGVAAKLALVGYHWEEQDGKQVQVRGLGVEADDVQIERGADGKSGRLTVDYGRTVKLKPLEQYWTLKFHTSREATLRP